MQGRPASRVRVVDEVGERSGRLTLVHRTSDRDEEASRTGASRGRLLIVSNRLPMTVAGAGEGRRLVPSSGGLATGLRGVHAQSGGAWIGWSGEASDPAAPADAAIERAFRQAGALPVPLSADEVAGFYDGFANETLWPLLHGRTDLARSSDAAWERYCAVNERFARVVARQVRPGDRVWVHDYHLLLVPRFLRRFCPEARIGFFLHTPMADVAALARLPFRQRASLLDGVLGADLAGFHTAADAARFAAAVRDTLGRDPGDADRPGAPRGTAVGVFPMGIDAATFAARAGDPQVGAEVRRLRAAGGPLFVGVDRLDYTKGIPERLDAFARLLERFPELHGRARLVQLAVPSREHVPAYRALRAHVEARVARINARFGRAGWTPVEYAYGTADPAGLAALYRAADVMLVTPLRDGMNLVAKEFVASRVDEDGVLVLGEHAGAASQLRTAVRCDPSDVDGLTAAYADALALSRAERRVRMQRMRATVMRHDVAWWAASFLDALGGTPAAAPGTSDARRGVAGGHAAAR
jgi:trehalose 6-phosphate synthase/phosphatase